MDRRPARCPGRGCSLSRPAGAARELSGRLPAVRPSSQAGEPGGARGLACQGPVRFQAQRPGVLEYQVPAGWARLADLLQVLEEGKAAGSVRRYAVAPAALEQVFVDFVAEQPPAPPAPPARAPPAQAPPPPLQV